MKPVNFNDLPAFLREAIIRKREAQKAFDQMDRAELSERLRKFGKPL